MLLTYTRLNYVCDAGYSPPNTQVSVKYWRKVGSLSIDMSADNRTTALSRHIHQRLTDMSVDMLTDKQPIYRLICLPTYRSRVSIKIYQPRYQLRFGWHIDRYIGQVSVDQSTQHPRKLGHFLQKCYWSSLLNKRVMLERYFGWLLLSLEIAFNYFFNAVKMTQILLSDWQSELARWTYLNTQDFPCLPHKRKFSFRWEYKMFQSRWVDIVFLDHYTFLEG